ncbi:capping complex subunit for YIEGIA, partial [Bacillus sp. D-CC]
SVDSQVNRGAPPANNLEAILDGIAHRLQENVYIIVKH